jgi:hypothetical protein
LGHGDDEGALASSIGGEKRRRDADAADAPLSSAQRIPACTVFHDASAKLIGIGDGSRRNALQRGPKHGIYLGIGQAGKNRPPRGTGVKGCPATKLDDVPN